MPETSPHTEHTPESAALANIPAYSLNTEGELVVADMQVRSTVSALLAKIEDLPVELDADFQDLQDSLIDSNERLLVELRKLFEIETSDNPDLQDLVRELRFTMHRQARHAFQDTAQRPTEPFRDSQPPPPRFTNLDPEIDLSRGRGYNVSRSLFNFTGFDSEYFDWAGRSQEEQAATGRSRVGSLAAKLSKDLGLGQLFDAVFRPRMRDSDTEERETFDGTSDPLSQGAKATSEGGGMNVSTMRDAYDRGELDRDQYETVLDIYALLQEWHREWRQDDREDEARFRMRAEETADREEEQAAREARQARRRKRFEDYERAQRQTEMEPPESDLAAGFASAGAAAEEAGTGDGGIWDALTGGAVGGGLAAMLKKAMPLLRGAGVFGLIVAAVMAVLEARKWWENLDRDEDVDRDFNVTDEGVTFNGRTVQDEELAQDVRNWGEERAEAEAEGDFLRAAMLDEQLPDLQRRAAAEVGADRPVDPAGNVETARNARGAEMGGVAEDRVARTSESPGLTEERARLAAGMEVGMLSPEDAFMQWNFGRVGALNPFSGETWKERWDSLMRHWSPASNLNLLANPFEMDQWRFSTDAEDPAEASYVLVDDATDDSPPIPIHLDSPKGRQIRPVLEGYRRAVEEGAPDEEMRGHRNDLASHFQSVHTRYRADPADVDPEIRDPCEGGLTTEGWMDRYHGDIPVDVDDPTGTGGMHGFEERADRPLWVDDPSVYVDYALRNRGSKRRIVTDRIQVLEGELAEARGSLRERESDPEAEARMGPSHPQRHVEAMHRRGIEDDIARKESQLERLRREMRKLGVDPSAEGGMIPEMHEGGVVPGPRGSERLVVAQGGEVVLPLPESLADSADSALMDTVSQSLTEMETLDPAYSAAAPPHRSPTPELSPTPEPTPPAPVRRGPAPPPVIITESDADPFDDSVHASVLAYASGLLERGLM